MSDTPVRVIYNCETKEETIIPLTAEEIVELEASIAEAEKQRLAFEAELAAKQSVRQSAIAKLASLGLTEEEAAAIVGA